MSVTDSLSRKMPPGSRHTRQASSPRSHHEAAKADFREREPIYHTLEPPPQEDDIPRGTVVGNDTVYINERLELVYPSVVPANQVGGTFPVDSRHLELLVDHEDDQFLEVGEVQAPFPNRLTSQADESYQSQRSSQRNISQQGRRAPKETFYM